MIDNSSVILLALLLALTLLGAVMGYCAALLTMKRKARKLIAFERDRISRKAQTIDMHLQSNENTDALYRSPYTGSAASVGAKRKRGSSAGQNKLSSGKFAKIRLLEAKLAALREDKDKNHTDDASYRSREQEALSAASRADAIDDDTHRLPILMRRVEGAKSTSALPVADSEHYSQKHSRELEIPSLSESDLVDTGEDLEFDAMDFEDDGGVNPRG